MAFTGQIALSDEEKISLWERLREEYSYRGQDGQGFDFEGTLWEMQNPLSEFVKELIFRPTTWPTEERKREWVGQADFDAQGDVEMLEASGNENVEMEIGSGEEERTENWETEMEGEREEKDTSDDSGAPHEKTAKRGKVQKPTPEERGTARGAAYVRKNARARTHRRRK